MPHRAGTAARLAMPVSPRHIETPPTHTSPLEELPAWPAGRLGLPATTAMLRWRRQPHETVAHAARSATHLVFTVVAHPRDVPLLPSHHTLVTLPSAKLRASCHDGLDSAGGDDVDREPRPASTKRDATTDPRSSRTAVDAVLKVERKRWNLAAGTGAES